MRLCGFESVTKRVGSILAKLEVRVGNLRLFIGGFCIYNIFIRNNLRLCLSGN